MLVRQVSGSGFQCIDMIPFQSDEYAHCCDLVDFAIEMKQKLEEINKHSFNRFQLRIGEEGIGQQLLSVSPALPQFYRVTHLVSENLPLTQF